MRFVLILSAAALVVCNGDSYSKLPTTYGTPEYSYHQPLGWKDSTKEDNGREKDAVSLGSRPGASQDIDSLSSIADLGGNSGVVLGADPLRNSANLVVNPVVSSPLISSDNLPVDPVVSDLLSSSADQRGSSGVVQGEDPLRNSANLGAVQSPGIVLSNSDRLGLDPGARLKINGGFSIRGSASLPGVLSRFNSGNLISRPGVSPGAVSLNIGVADLLNSLGIDRSIDVGDRDDGLDRAFELVDEDLPIDDGDDVPEGPDGDGVSSVIGDSSDLRNSGDFLRGSSDVGDSSGLRNSGDFLRGSSDVGDSSGLISGDLGDSSSLGSDILNRVRGQKPFVSFLNPATQNKRYTWYQADYQCRIRGMELISIESERTNDLVNQLLLMIPNRHLLRITWTSGRRRRRGVFRWANGRRVSRRGAFTNWGTKGLLNKPQPDNAFGNEYCLAALDAPITRGPIWDDISCDDIATFICVPKKRYY